MLRYFLTRHAAIASDLSSTQDELLKMAGIACIHRAWHVRICGMLHLLRACSLSIVLILAPGSVSFFGGAFF